MNIFAHTNVSGVRTMRRRRLDAASELLKTLAAPVRLAILVELRESPRCVHELVDTLEVSQPLVSQHLRVLRAARLVAAARRGREVEYSLADEHVAHIVDDAIRHTEEDRP
jgi:ArsR family transcriptional regulator, zinc-responsive transcriptional repressor